MGAPQSESDRALYGHLGSDWDIAYTLVPLINFAPVTNDGTGMRKLETSLTLTDARSGAQVTISSGSPSGFSFGAQPKAIPIAYKKLTSPSLATGYRAS